MTSCSHLCRTFYCASRSFMFSNITRIQSPIVCSTRNYREIVGYKDGKVTTITATMHVPKETVIAPRHIPDDPCPLRSRGIQITPEDVLILRQFITSTGEILSRKETGLCRHEYFKVIGCVKMAQRSNMLPGPENDTSVTPNGRKLNRYLTRYPIGTRTPIKGRGLWYMRNHYKVGDARVARDAPYVSRKGVLTHH